LEDGTLAASQTADTAQEETKKPLMIAKLTCECAGVRHEKVTAELYPDMIAFSGSGFSQTIKLNTLIAVEAADYRVTVRRKRGDLTLSMLGHLYEDFVRCFVRAFNEIVFRESLMGEKTHFEAKGQYTAPQGGTSEAVFRICETALVVLPQTHALLRIPFCLMARVSVEPYRLTITDKRGRRHVLQKLGFSTDDFLREFRRRETELLKQTKERLSGIAPVNDALASLMMEGLVVPIERIREASASFADALEAKLLELMPKEYGYLKTVSDEMAAGVKRGLMGSLTGESIILLARAGGKAVMESLGEAAAATYVFDMGAQPWEDFLPAFNESMLAVNFRREPIYMSDEALEKNETYANAAARCPALAELRRRYIGRAAHSGFDAWRRSIESYIR